MNAISLGFTEEGYLGLRKIKTMKSKVKRKLLLFDAHINKNTPKQYQIVKRFIPSFKPDEIILGGDFADCKALSRWNENKKLSLEGLYWDDEVVNLNAELDYLQRYCKKITYLEGNHEDWANQYIERKPAMKKTVGIQKQLKLNKRGIKWVRLNELYKSGNLYTTHGVFTNKYHSTAHIQSLGCNVAYGHIHRNQTDMMNMKMIDPIEGTAFGCLCGHSPEYLKGKHANWIGSFGIQYIYPDGKNYNLYRVNIINNQFCWEGKMYR